MDEMFRAISAIKNPVTLVAFAVAAIVFVVMKRRGKVPRRIPKTIVLLVLIGAASWGFEAWVGYGEKAIYRVRVTVLSAQGLPVDDARLWSSAGGESKKVAGGWQFDLPSAAIPKDGKVTFYATMPAAFLAGKQEMTLGSDFNPTVAVRLASDTSANVRGIVIDSVGKAIAGVRVVVVGYETQVTETGISGNFELPSHAADGQQIQLHAEKKGYRPVSQWHPAGREPATIILEKR